MKKILAFCMVLAAFSSCQEDVQFSNPGFQGYKDDKLWRASTMTASIATNGNLTIEGRKGYETTTLTVNSTKVGTYYLGTKNTNIVASFVSTFADAPMNYATIPSVGPVSNVSITAGGLSYISGGEYPTIGGSGSGLTVKVEASSTGKVTGVSFVSRGNGYLPGDVITVDGGDGKCKLTVMNSQVSNGEIEITEFDSAKMTVSGKFKFNAVKTQETSTGNTILNFQNGEFYKVRVYPSM